MRNNFLLFTFLIFLIASACDRLLMKEKRQEIDKINLKGLMDTLHFEVASANPLLTKKAWLNQKSDSTSTHLDSLSWVKEFDGFSDLKIRPGRLFSDYHEKITGTDSAVFYQYSSIDPEKEPLDSLFIFTDSEERIVKLEAYKNDRNYFSSSHEYLFIQFFVNDQNIRLPLEYKLSGWQKIKTRDTISYQIEAYLTY